MIFLILLWSFAALAFPDSAYCKKIEHDLDLMERSNDVEGVEFLIWSPNQQCSWNFNWQTWDWSCVEDADSIRFDSNVDVQFEAVPANHFKRSAKTIIVIHGFTENGRAEWKMRMKDEFFKKDPVPNVITVEWSRMAQGPDYEQAAQNTQKVGPHVANFIKYLIDRPDTTFTLDDFYIIGFSLGGQVAGFAGKTLGGKLPRITALDPAGPLFDGKGNDERIDKSDAYFVDVIHTETSGQECGHLDFWPNGGRHPMPGCEGLTWWETIWNTSCSHFKATGYYIESINSDVGFPATKCESYEKFTDSKCNGNAQKMMGYLATVPADGSQEGNYYLYTNAEYPFALE